MKQGRLVFWATLYLAPGLTTRFLNDKLGVLSYSLCKKPGFLGLVENAARCGLRLSKQIFFFYARFKLITLIFLSCSLFPVPCSLFL
jgi:hypothetical protein